MIQAQNVARQINHNIYAIDTARDDDGSVALVFTLNPGVPHAAEAHVYSLTEEQAKVLEDGIRQARTGIVPASELPGRNGNGF